jgi:hypothetical protein
MIEPYDRMIEPSNARATEIALHNVYDIPWLSVGCLSGERQFRVRYDCVSVNSQPVL